MMMEESEGEGQKPLQFTMRISISHGESLVLDRRSSMTGKSTICTSWMDSCRWVLGGMYCKAGGKKVSSLSPEEVSSLAMKEILSESKH